ncbi:MAG TPA: MaoC family dehydratase [Mycobacteriales bacterium]|nr:MaoC family dehydratase [Mycobacteriales bacterium]
MSPFVDDIAAGDELPELVLPLDRTIIMATAIASRDYQEVHHDPGLAVLRGSKDIFMNILSTNGFCGRFVTDWAGPDAVISNVSIRLGVPNYAGDVMTMTGKVTELDPGTGEVTVAVQGANSLGNHVTGTVTLTLPRRAAA